MDQISIAKLNAKDKNEIDRLIEATITVGFFYAVDHGVNTDVIRKQALALFALKED